MLTANLENDAYKMLITWLRANALEWVAVQIEDEVALGTVAKKQVAISTELQQFGEQVLSIGLYEVPRSRKPRSAEFLARNEYTPAEKFGMALEAVEAVVIGAVKIQDVLVKTLSGDNREVNVFFDPGETGDVSHRFRSADIAKFDEPVKDLVGDLVTLRKEVRGVD